jgi:hypothetical protein
MVNWAGQCVNGSISIHLGSAKKNRLLGIVNVMLVVVILELLKDEIMYPRQDQQNYGFCTLHIGHGVGHENRIFVVVGIRIRTAYYTPIP